MWMGRMTCLLLQEPPTCLSPEQRRTLTQILTDLSDREIARSYTGGSGSEQASEATS